MINGPARNSRSCSYWEHDNDWYTKESAKCQARSLLLINFARFLFAALVIDWILTPLNRYVGNFRRPFINVHHVFSSCPGQEAKQANGLARHSCDANTAVQRC